MLLLYPILAALVGLATTASIAVLLFVLAAAALGKRRFISPGGSHDPLRLVVIVPAHNEELVLTGTLESLRAQTYPTDCFEVVVVADNCSDTTAGLARSQGVTVFERVDAGQRGKGFALNHAVSFLLARSLPPDGFVIVDADTWVAPDFLSLISARLAAGQDSRGYAAWQGRYGVLNSGESWRTGLMAAAFDLVNHVKPLGREALQLSVGLKGNGMAFTRAVAAEVPWPGGSLTEDLDYSLELARGLGLRVGYAPEARVLAQMPTNADQAGSQRSRWERGRLRMVRERALPLMWEGLRRRNRLLLDMGLDLLIPPLAELSALTILWLGLVGLGAATHLLPYSEIWFATAGVSGIGLLVYVLGGLRVAEAPPEAYAALTRAPFYALWKFALLISGAARKPRGQSGEEWVRTARTPIASDKPASTASPVTKVPPQ